MFDVCFLLGSIFRWVDWLLNLGNWTCEVSDLIHTTTKVYILVHENFFMFFDGIGIVVDLFLHLPSGVDKALKKFAVGFCQQLFQNLNRHKSLSFCVILRWHIRLILVVISKQVLTIIYGFGSVLRYCSGCPRSFQNRKLCTVSINNHLIENGSH